MPLTVATTTSSATPTILGPLPIFAAPGASLSLRGTVTARNTASGDSASWDVAALIKGSGQVATVATQSVTQFEADPSLTAATVAVSTAGGSVALIVTGPAGATVNWTGSFAWTAA